MFNDTHLSEAGKLLGKVHVARIPNNLIEINIGDTYAITL